MPIERLPVASRVVVTATALLLLGAAAGAAQTPPPAASSCVSCHQTLQEGRLASPPAAFAQPDVHRESGFRCVDCHGGNAAAADSAGAHSAAQGFRGVPTGQAQIAVCARCHSDAALMRRFSPRQRIDQAAEYATSVHGQRLAAGDARVATCTSCHGAHGIRRVKDAKSPVFRTNVAATCGRCHADAERMRGYTRPDGTPLPTNQLAEYRKSIHHAMLTKGNDLSAPTCNDCHGNHGAAPPGVGSVTNVCGTCHAIFAQRFETSVHRQIFDKGCVECHGNHAVLKPTDDMLGTDAKALCGSCHSGPDDKGVAAATSMRRDLDRLKSTLDRSAALVSGLKNAGMETTAQQLGLAEARTRITLARTELHAFDPARVTPVVAEGLKILGEVDAAGQQASVELRFRRRGLAVSLAVILLFVLGLWLKIRQIERSASS